MPNKREFNKRHFDKGITEWKLSITWSDGLLEDIGKHLPQYLINEIEEYFEEIDRHRDTVGQEYVYTVLGE